MTKQDGGAGVKGLFYLVLGLSLGPYLLHEIYANDLWKSLYFARYVARFGAFPPHASFAFTPTVTPVPSDVYSWLGHLVIHGVYQLGSFPGLSLFRVVLVAISLGLIHSLVQFRTDRLTCLILLLWGVGLVQKTLVRTAIFVIPAVSLFWWSLARCRDRSNGWLWVTLPPLFMIWSNLHGSYLYGMGLLGLIIIGGVIDRARSIPPYFQLTCKQWLALFGLLVLIVTFVKPYPDDKLYRTVEYGLSIPVETVQLLTDQGIQGPSTFQAARELIYQGKEYEGEMRSIAGRRFSLRYVYVPYVLASLLLGWGTVLVMLRRRLRLSLLFPVLATVLMGMCYLRFVALIPLTAAPVLFISFRDDDFKWGQYSPKIRWTTVVLIVLLGAVPWVYTVNNRMSTFMHNRQFQVGVSKSGPFSDRLPAYVLRTYPDEPVFTHYDIGGYLIWRWWPEKKVFIDSKNWGYERSFRNRYLRSSPPEMMNSEGIELAVLPLTSAWNYYLFIPSPDWRVLRYDQGMVLYGPQSRFESAPDQQNLLTKEDVINLDEEDRRRIKAFQRFIGRHGNRPDHVGVLTSPE